MQAVVLLAQLKTMHHPVAELDWRLYKMVSRVGSTTRSTCESPSSHAELSGDCKILAKSIEGMQGEKVK